MFAESFNNVEDCYKIETLKGRGTLKKNYSNDTGPKSRKLAKNFFGNFKPMKIHPIFNSLATS